MISELARVFSSQGVLIQGTTYASRPSKLKFKSENGAAQNPADSFSAQFDQASAKLELSKAAKEKMNAGGEPLSEEEQKVVEDMAKRDKEVRAHEQAHLANAGGVAKGGANYEFKTGPDDKLYAVGGHVNIDASPIKGNPSATIQKAQAVQRAALAPSDPSGQDRAMAAAAAQMALQAQKEMAAGGETSESPQSTIKNGDEKVQSYSRSGASMSRAMGSAVSVYA